MTEIRPERASDHDAIRTVVAAAFKSQLEADLVDAIRSSPQYIPELALVAEIDGEIAGHVMVSHVELIDGSTTHTIHSLSPLAVAPALHGQGIGSALVEGVLAAAAEHGAGFVVLEGDPRYYSRFGFEPSAKYGISIDLPDWAPPEAAQIRLLSDARPSLSGTVRYSAAFTAVINH